MDETNKNFHVEISQKNLERVIYWISVADSKAIGLLAIWTITAAGFCATITTVVQSLDFYLKPVPTTIVIMAGIFYVSVAIITLFRLFKVIYPRQRSLFKLKSPFYGESILAYKEDEFVELMKKITKKEIIEHLAKQTWRMQHVCSGKFTDLQASRNLLISTVIFILLYTIISTLVLY